MTEVSEPQAIQILDDLLNGGPAAPPSPLTALPTSFPASVAPAAPQSIIAPQTATAAQQAAPGTTPPIKGPQVISLPSVISRGTVVGQGNTAEQVIVELNSRDSFESNFAKLLIKDLELAQHDRSMAIALFQTHLDRAEVLDQMALSMPVATVIADNTGASLKSLELAMKAGERVHKAAELLVAAQKNGDAAMLTALKLKQGKSDDWGEDAP